MPMNVGIIGCGRVTGLRHLPALRTLEEARVVALADVDAGRLDVLADEHAIPLRYHDAADLIADDDVQAVAVCVPVSAHADVAVPALAAGKHVFVEKPLALSLEDAERVREAAAAAPGTIVMGFNLRWHRLVRRARELVRSGALGGIEAVRTIFTSSFDYRAVAHAWRFRRELGGGSVVEMGPHHLDMWRFLTGLEVDEVFAVSRSAEDEDDSAVLCGILEGGVLAETVVSQRSTNVHELEVLGERGRLRVSCYRYDGLELQLGRGFGGDLRHRLRGVARAAGELPAFMRGVRGASDYVESYRAEWKHFVEAASVRTTPDAGIEDGVRNVEVLVAILGSLESGGAVRVERAAAVAT